MLGLAIIFAVSTIRNYNFSDHQEHIDDYVVIHEDTNLKSPKKSDTYTETFIHVDETNNNLNWSYTAANNDWCYYENGHYIIENVTLTAVGSGSGILIENSNVTFIIRNCNVTNTGTGAYDAGIEMINTSNGTLINNYCYDNGRIGILLADDCDNNKVTGNTATNVAGSAQDFGILLYQYCDNNIILGNTANNNEIWGIRLEYWCHNNTISGNTGSNVGTSKQDWGIGCKWYCENNTFSENTANDNTWDGINLNDECLNNTIKGNTANDNDRYGILLYDECNNNTISGNTVNLSGDNGIYLWINCSSNEILGNTANDNGADGIRIYDDCDDNTIIGNLFKNNQNYGITIEGGACENNLLYFNSLKENLIYHASDSGTNTQWNISEVGNYWDNHTTPDSNNDGIVDIPYTWIDGSANSEDNFPLVESPLYGGEKIHIDDSGVSALNWSMTAKLKYWCSGSGAYSDPYVIIGLEINGSGSGIGILIGNSSAYFIIEYCMIYNAEVGIEIMESSNMTIINNNINDINGTVGINGGLGTDGGAGSAAIGIALYDCVNANISLNNINNISGGNGGLGGNGADGNPGGPGGKGGNGNNAYGIYFNNSKEIYNSYNNISSIIGGKGSAGGKGGKGDNGDPGKNGGIGGAGGSGGLGSGIYYENSTYITNEWNNIWNIMGGAGGNGGTGGAGGNGGSSSEDGGDGNVGGAGGSSGLGFGIYYDNSTHIINEWNSIWNIASSAGGSGGVGGVGGNGLYAGAGGNGEAGGVGGLSWGIYYNNSTHITNDWNSIWNIMGGAAVMGAQVVMEVLIQLAVWGELVVMVKLVGWEA